ncbi:hypothetical protein V12B01_13005 [Vibrio splendidus 12B01]|nr:hypothetical protein V12B01_13005 [Vibrio splendidus 12B01]EAQ54981.1 hypothetical protein MED222_05185 [Vibrio sp. MED222]
MRVNNSCRSSVLLIGFNHEI